MHKTIKTGYFRFLALAVATLLVLCTAPRAQAAEASGSCGDGVNWEVTGGVLTISGSGPMANYDEAALAPWSGLDVTAVHIAQGVQSIGDFAFFRMESVTAVTVADSVQTIGQYAFYGCKGLTLLELGQGVQSIGQSAFEQCVSLMVLRLPNSVNTLGQQAFYCCEALQTITVPASVTEMDSAVFAHCTGLRSASVQAQISALPIWTFYGCTSLESVILDPMITETGVEAFEGCAMSQPPVRETIDFQGTVVHSSERQDEEGNTTKYEYIDSGNSAISSQTGSDGQTSMEAVLENSSGWAELGGQVETTGDNTQVQVNLKSDTTVKGEDLAPFAGQNVTLQVQTAQGAVWTINGSDLTPEALGEEYSLSYTIRALTEPTDAQQGLIGSGTAFIVVFDSSIDFKTEVAIPLGAELARKTACFFAPEEESYTNLQQVLVDDAGKAHFYLQQVEGGVEYIVGVDIQTSQETAPLIPEPLKEDYGVNQEEQIEYVVTGVKSSWGMDIKQVTWILVAVMVGSVIVVGLVIGLLNRRKLKRGYIPGDDLDKKQ